MSTQPSEHSTPLVQTRADTFATTRWSVVMTAGGRNSPLADHALEELCRTYWYPLYAYVRRRGHSHEDAEDLTQGFFSRFLGKNYLAGLDSQKGRFRAFLLASLKNHLANEWDRAHRQKRGGSDVTLSLDWHGADSRYRIDLADALTPDKVFDREWALALLECVIARLGSECAAAGQTALFEKLKPFLTLDKAAVPYSQAATDLAMTENAVRVAVHRLRRRYRALLRDEISQTLSDPAQLEEEMRALLGAFG